jgi:transcription antitermination factor NusG
MKNHTTDLCNKVNAQLNSTSTDTPKPTPSTTSFKVGDLVKINAGARYYNGGAIPQWVVNEKWYISSISGNRAVLGLNEAKNRNIQSPINTKDITLVKTQTTSTFKEYTKSFKGTDKIYGTAGGTVVGTIGTSGIYTIVDEKTVGTVTYGKLKSGKGWVIVRQQDVQIKKGDKVKVKSGKNYIYGTNNKFTMFVSVYTVLEINGDRVVISSDGKNVTTAINKNNLEKA